MPTLQEYHDKFEKIADDNQKKRADIIEKYNQCEKDKAEAEQKYSECMRKTQLEEASTWKLKANELGQRMKVYNDLLEENYFMPLIDSPDYDEYLETVRAQAQKEINGIFKDQKKDFEKAKQLLQKLKSDVDQKIDLANETIHTLEYDVYQFKDHWEKDPRARTVYRDSELGLVKGLYSLRKAIQQLEDLPEERAE
ncbi:MAG: hypothetical protein Q4A55_00175 [Aerococcus sp.]|nr:hypothetical protein [Aerococcus sp.]